MVARIGARVVIVPPAAPGPADWAGPGDQARRLRLMHMLAERIAEIEAAVEDGRPDLKADAMGGALATIDEIDHLLGQVEDWIARLAQQDGVFIGAARTRHGAELAAARARHGGAA